MRRLLTEVRPLFDLAWPVVGAQLALMSMGVVDTAVAGRLGAEALGSVALGHAWSFSMVIPALGLATGLDPFFSQSYGAGEKHEAGRNLVRGAVLLVAVALPVMALHLLAGPGLALIQQPAELIGEADTYVRIVGLSVPSFLGFALVRRFLQGSGRMREATVIGVIASVANLVLDGVLALGWLGMPALGVEGIAWATVICRTGMVAGLAWIGRDAIFAAWDGIRPALRLAPLWRMAKVASPVGVHTAVEVWAFTASAALMGWLGALELAGHVVALNLASLAFMIPMGIGTAAATRVGNLLGAGARWQLAGWTAVAMGAGVMTASAMTFALVPEGLARLYTDDMAVIAMAASLLPVAAFFQLFDGVQVVTAGVLRGAGDTAIPSILGVVGFWLLGLPCAYILTFTRGWGAVGVWAGLSLGLAAVSILLVMRLRAVARRGGLRVTGSTADTP